MVWQTLTDHLEVVYGAALALVIVAAALTPPGDERARGLGFATLAFNNRSSRGRPGPGPGAVAGQREKAHHRGHRAPEEPREIRDRMLEATDTKHAPWYIVRSDNKKRARLNCISHLLSLIPYKKLPREKIKIPKRSKKREYDDQATLKGRRIIPEVY